MMSLVRPVELSANFQCLRKNIATHSIETPQALYYMIAHCVSRRLDVSTSSAVFHDAVLLADKTHDSDWLYRHEKSRFSVDLQIALY
jgi:hypothetical protein